MVNNQEIHLKAIETKDLDLIKSWRNNESLRRFFREYREFSMTQIENWYFEMIKSKDFEMFLIYQDKKPVGVTGLTYIDWVNRHADVHFYIGIDGLWIDEKIAPNAINLILDYGFSYLNLNKLWVEIYDIDSKKITFFQERNFKKDAVLRDHYFYDGEYHDSFIFSLLRKDYSK